MKVEAGRYIGIFMAFAVAPLLSSHRLKPPSGAGPVQGIKPRGIAAGPGGGGGNQASMKNTRSRPGPAAMPTPSSPRNESPNADHERLNPGQGVSR